MPKKGKSFKDSSGLTRKKNPHAKQKARQKKYRDSKGRFV